MAEYRLSRRAESDLEEIALYGIETFGIEQTIRYRDGLKAHLRAIAQAPMRYPKIDNIRPGYRRSVYERHAIYYRSEGNRVLIVRILGRQDVATALCGT